MRLYPCLLALPLAACREPDPEEEGPPPMEWQSVADWTDRGVTPAAGSACGEMLPVDVTGRTMRYEWSQRNRRGARVVEAMGRDDAAGVSAWKEHAAVYIETANDAWVQLETSWYVCDDEGVWVVGRAWNERDADDALAFPGEPDEYCEDYYWGFRTLEPGAEHGGLTSCDEVDGGSWLQSRGERVGEAVEVEVPAGTFTAFEVTRGFDTVHVVPDVGVVQQEGESRDAPAFALFDAG
jgi:hypothetical protein